MFPTQVDAVSGTSVASLAGSSLTPVSGELYLVVVANFHASVGTPTLSGTNGFAVTWTQVATEPNAGSAQRATVFRGVASSGVAGVLTADFGGVSQSVALMVTVRCPSVDQASAQGVKQSAVATQAASSAPTVTLGAYTQKFNVAIMFSMTNQNTTWTNSTAEWTPGTVAAAAGGALGAMFRAHSTLDVSPVGTFGASGITCSVGVELTAAALTGDARSPDAYSLCQCGPSFFRGVVLGFGQDMLFGSGGPAGYPAGDSAGLTAVQDTAVGAYAAGIGYWPLRTQRDNVVGTPDAPSQIQGRAGTLRGIVVPLAAGTYVVAVRMKTEQDTGVNRPQLVVVADDAVGLSANATAEAGTGTDWQTLSVEFTTARDGAVEVLRVKRGHDHVRVWWDDLRVYVSG